MALTIDQLNIQIVAESRQATAALDAYISRFEKMQSTMTRFGKTSGTATRAITDVSKSAKNGAKGVDTYSKSVKNGAVSTQSLTDKLTRSISKWTVLIGAVKRVASVMSGWYKESNSYIETLNFFEVAMGESTTAAKEFAETVQSTMGIDAKEWMNYQATFQNLAKGFGVASDSATKMSQNLTQLAYDMSSIRDVDVEVAFDKLSSAMAGQVKGLRELGIDTTVATLQEYARAKGIEKTVRSMTQAEKAMLRYNYIMEQSRDLGYWNDMAKTIATPANALRILTAQFTQLKRALGNIISVLVTQFIPYIQIMVEALTDAANAIAKFFGFELPKVNDIDYGMGEFSDELEEGEESAKEIKKQLMGFDELNIIGDPASGGAESGSSAMDMELLEYDFLKNLDTSKADAIKQQFKDIGSAVADTAKAIEKYFGFDKVWDGISKGIKKIDFKEIEDSAKSIFSGLEPIAKSAVKGVSKVYKSLAKSVGRIFEGILPLWGKELEIAFAGVDGFLGAEGENIGKWINEVASNISWGMLDFSSGIKNIFDSLTGKLDENKERVGGSIEQLLWSVSETVMAIGSVVSGLFEVIGLEFSIFTTQEKPLIDEFLNGVIETVTLFSDSVTGIVGGIFSSVREWWETDGKGVWDGIVDVFFDLTAIIMEFWDDTIKPVFDYLATTLTNLWNDHLEPLWNNILGFITSVWDFLKAMWDGILKPIVDFVVKFIGPPIIAVVENIIDVVETIIGVIVDVVSGIFKALGGLLDFITGIFTGNWEKAWNGIKNFFGGIWNAIWGAVKGVINLIIDGLNSLWRGLYSVLAGIINGVGGLIEAIGEIFGADWGWEIPSQPPLIPKLAEGGIVDAGQMFIAREAGPELVGSIGRKTAVANNDQIVSGIEAGVYRAMMAANAGGGRGTQTIRIINEIDGDVVGEKVIQYHNGKVMQTGVSPLLV